MLITIKFELKITFATFFFHFHLTSFVWVLLRLMTSVTTDIKAFIFTIWRIKYFVQGYLNIAPSLKE